MGDFTLQSEILTSLSKKCEDLAILGLYSQGASTGLPFRRDVSSTVWPPSGPFPGLLSRVLRYLPACGRFKALWDFYSKSTLPHHLPPFSTPCGATSFSALAWRGGLRPNFLLRVLITAFQGRGRDPWASVLCCFGAFPRPLPPALRAVAYQGVGRRRWLGYVSVAQVAEHCHQKAHAEQEGAREGVSPRPVCVSKEARAGRVRLASGLGPSQVWVLRSLGLASPALSGPGLGSLSYPEYLQGWGKSTKTGPPTPDLNSQNL